MRLFIKNMVSARCVKAVQDVMEKLNLKNSSVGLGEVMINETLSDAQSTGLRSLLHECGFELLEHKKAILIERIKNVIVQLVHHSSEKLKTNFSVFLSKQLGYNYTYLANVFSGMQGRTIENFLISHKIERAKEMLTYSDASLKEIASLLHYSSVGHLSNQFKMITGFRPTFFKQQKSRKRSSIEDV